MRPPVNQFQPRKAMHDPEFIYWVWLRRNCTGACVCACGRVRVKVCVHVDASGCRAEELYRWKCSCVWLAGMHMPQLQHGCMHIAHCTCTRITKSGDAITTAVAGNASGAGSHYVWFITCQVLLVHWSVRPALLSAAGMLQCRPMQASGLKFFSRCFTKCRRVPLPPVISHGMELLLLGPSRAPLP